MSRRERGRVFQETAVKEEKAREPTVDSSVRGIWNVRVLELERGVREGV